MGGGLIVLATWGALGGLRGSSVSPYVWADFQDALMAWWEPSYSTRALLCRYRVRILTDEVSFRKGLGSPYYLIGNIVGYGIWPQV